MTPNLQSAYQVGRVPVSDDVDEDIVMAMRLYMTDDLGIPADVADKRARAELDRGMPKSVLRSLTLHGIDVGGKATLDLGAGLGGMSEELVLNGASVTALEPGQAWAALTKRRIERHQRPFQLLNAYGESIPLPDGSMDLIVSLQVLEHVRDPDKVLAEAWRVLRPGGHFFLSCENYLAFREGHYQLPWLPLLPKSLGKAYLGLLGRSPKFLDESITYTTYPRVVGRCRKLGFVRIRDQELSKKVESGAGAGWQLMRALGAASGGHAPRWIDDMRNLFKFGIRELFAKPV